MSNIFVRRELQVSFKALSLALTHVCAACRSRRTLTGRKKKQKKAWHVQTQITQNNGPLIKKKQPEGKLRTVLFSVILWNWSLNISQPETDSTGDLMRLNNLLEVRLMLNFCSCFLKRYLVLPLAPGAPVPLLWKSPSPTCCSPEASALLSPGFVAVFKLEEKCRSEVTEGGLAEGASRSPLLDREPPSITVSPRACSMPASKARGKWGRWSYVACGSASMNHRSAADRFIWRMNISSSPWNNPHIDVKITVHSKYRLGGNMSSSCLNDRSQGCFSFTHHGNTWMFSLIV